MNPLERVAALADEAEAPSARAASSRGIIASSNGFDLANFIARHGLQARKEKSKPDGAVLYELAACPFNPDHKKGSAFITRAPDGTLGFGCHHNSCAGKDWKALRAFLEPDYRPNGSNGAQGPHRQGSDGNGSANGADETVRKAGGQPADAGSLITRRIADIEAKPISWLWPDRIARGKVTVLAGDPGLGKSQITASIAAVVTTGGQWPVTRERCEAGDVLFLTAEDDVADTLRPRLEAAGANLERVHVIDGVITGYTADGSPQDRMFSLEKDLRALEQKLAELHDVAVVVIDPISAYLGSVDSHRNSEVRGLLAPLGQIAARHNVAIIAITHLNKGGAAKALMRILESVAFVALARAVFLVTADPEDKMRRLFLPAKNNIAQDTDGLAFRIEGAVASGPEGQIQTSRVMWESGTVTVTADEAVQSDATKARCTAVEEAADWLREILANGAMPYTELSDRAQAEGFSEKTLQRAKKKLGVQPTKEGYQGPWLWTLSSKVAKNPKDAHTQGLGTFGEVGHLCDHPQEVQPSSDVSGDGFAEEEI